MTKKGTPPKRQSLPKGQDEERPIDRPKVGVLVPQPNGRGAIWQGTPRNIVPGPGRPRDLWRQRCETVLNNAKALDVLADIISGDILEKVGVDRKGEPIYGETKNRDRIKAFEVLAAYVYGPPGKEDEPAGGIMFGSQAEAVARLREQLPGLLRRLYPGYELRPVAPEEPSE